MSLLRKVPEDVLGSVLEYLLVEESARCSITCKNWSITAIFTLRWMYQQGKFHGRKGKQYLQPPPRTAGRVVNFRVGIVQERQPQPQQQQQRGRKKTQSRGAVPPTAPPPIAPSSPSTRVFLPPSLFATAGLRFSHNENRQPTTAETELTLKRKKKKSNAVRQKHISTRLSRPPLVPQSNNAQHHHHQQLHQQLLPLTRSKSSPPKMKGTSRGSSRGSARVVHVVPPPLVPPSHDPIFVCTNDDAHTPKTPVKSKCSRHGRKGRKGRPGRRARRDRLELPEHVAKQQHTNEEKEGSPYQFIDLKTKQLGTVLSALGGKSELQKYYIEQHQSKVTVKRSTTLSSHRKTEKFISFGRKNTRKIEQGK